MQLQIIAGKPAMLLGKLKRTLFMRLLGQTEMRDVQQNAPALTEHVAICWSQCKANRC